MSEKDLTTILKEEAALAEREEDSDDDVWVRSRRPPKTPSMVYSVRIPVSRVEELRQVAADAGVEPSAMVRQWLLDRLDSELSEEGRAVERIKSALESVLKAFKDEGNEWGLLLTPNSESLFEVVHRPAAAKRATKQGATTARSTKSSASKAVRKPAKAAKATKVAKAATTAKTKTGAIRRSSRG